MNKKTVIVIVGPTASGKTSLSIEIAKKLNGEIVSADSMQIYKEMDIATAKPTAEEMQGIPHHLMSFIEPTDNFSVADFKEKALLAIEDIFSRGKQPIVAGGTGFYIDTLIKNTTFFDFEIICRVYHAKCRLDEAQAGIKMPGEISITSDMQMTPFLRQKVKKN